MSYSLVVKQHTSEMHEGPAAFKRFDDAVKAIFSVTREEMARREEEYRKQAEANPQKRGPKRKTKPSASPDSAV